MYHSSASLVLLIADITSVNLETVNLFNGTHKKTKKHSNILPKLAFQQFVLMMSSDYIWQPGQESSRSGTSEQMKS